jgi:hypothetical protein
MGMGDAKETPAGSFLYQRARLNAPNWNSKFNRTEARKEG